MGNIVYSNILESSPGEDRVRPNLPSAPATSLAELAATIQPEHRKGFAALVAAFGISESGVGIYCLASDLQRDLHVLGQTRKPPDWVPKLETHLRVILERTPEQQVARDRYALNSVRKGPLRDFLTIPKGTLPPLHQRTLHAVRALVGIRLLSLRERLTGTVGSELARWFRGAVRPVSSPSDLSLDRLRAVLSALEAESRERKLVAMLISALEGHMPDPFPAPAVVPERTPIAISAKAADPLPTATAVMKRPAAPKKAPDLLQWRKAAISTAGSRIFSGISNLYDYLAPFELEEVIPRILGRRIAGQTDEADLALIAVFTGFLPSSYDRLPLTLAGEPGIALDLTAGHLCWNVDQVVGPRTAKAARYVRVPLPKELLVSLRERWQVQSEATRLADLFSVRLEELAKRSKVMLRGLALSSHRPTLSRLARSWGRYVLHRCHDETYASAIAIDLTLGTTSNLNYVRLRGARMAAIVGDCYVRVGLCGESGNEPADTGSERLPAMPLACALVRRLFNEAHDALTGLPRRCDQTRLHEAHNVIATRLYAAVKFLLGGRSLREETITVTCLDAERGLVTLTDKRTAPYHERRIVSLPEYVRAWFSSYLSWLRSLAYRLDGIDRHLSRRIAAVADPSNPENIHPLFFCFERNGRTRPLGAVDVAKLFADFGIAANAGRHFLDALFRDSALDSASIMGWMGRGMPGQEVYGSGSAIVPLAGLLDCSRVIEDWISTLGLPSAPEISPRQLPERQAGAARKRAYVPKLLQHRPASLKNAADMEPCPFVGGSTRLASQYVRMFSSWRRGAPPEGIAAVVLSLVFEDGVQQRGELMSAIDAIGEEGVYRCGDLHFLDCTSPELGRRRIWLSPVTVRLVFCERWQKPSGERGHEIDDGVAAFLDRTNIRISGDPLSTVVSAAQAYVALRIPGILRAWMDGTTFSRTARPATIARELLGRCEHPTFSPGVHLSRRRNPAFVFETVRKLAEGVPRCRSHRDAIAELGAYLAEAADQCEPGSEQALTVGYCGYLASTQTNIRTIERYLGAVRPFLLRVVEAVSAQGHAAVDWAKLVSETLGRRSPEQWSAPEDASIQHFLSWQGIDVQRRARIGPPLSALKYSDRLTERECHVAVSLLANRRRTPGDEWHRAEAALRLMLDVAMRWDEVANLRICDVALVGRTPHIVVTEESSAALKSRNAKRVLSLHSTQTVATLSELHRMQRARYPDDPLVTLFGGEGEVRRNSSAKRLHDLVTEAMRCAGGSVAVHPHSSRHTVLTRQVQRLLLPEKVNSRAALDLRQNLFSISAAAGHSHFDVTVGDYVQDLDRVRRYWIDHLHADMATPSVAFVSRVTGIAESALRKRLSRGSSAGFDLLRGVDSGPPTDCGLKVCELASLIDPALTEIPWSEPAERAERLTARCAYLGLRICGESPDAASSASRLLPAEASVLEKGLADLVRVRDAQLIPNDVHRERFLETVMRAQLAPAIEAVAPSGAFLRTVAGAVRQVGEPLQLRTYDDARDFSRLLPPFAAAGIVLELWIRRSLSSSRDAEVLATLRALGFARLELKPPKCFPAGSACLVRFLPVSDSRDPPKRASAHLAFHACVALLSLHFQQGGKV